MLISIKIEKLFDIFDYDIEFKKEGITILTGPNGYGKTTVLRILDAFAKDDVVFFSQLLFKKIVLAFSDLDITLENKVEDAFFMCKSSNSEESLPIKKIRVDDSLRDVFFSSPIGAGKDSLINSLLYYHRQEGQIEDLERRQQFRSLPATAEVYFIREQRLLLPVIVKDKKRDVGKGHDTFRKAIEEYAEELQDIIKETLAKSSQIAQELDGSFPSRLFDQQQDISEDDFKLRFDKVKTIQKALSQFGLSDIKQDNHPSYKQENAKALCVYLDDTEHKLAVFSELLKKLQIFTDILNERRLTFKRIDISKEDGFKFSTSHGKALALGDLSSGEQQEVVLLYELLFKVKPGTLVLIDEPEISLHVAWQKQFLDDLLKIIELQKINVIIATHSPQIINNRWDLTVDLEENFQCESI